MASDGNKKLFLLYILDVLKEYSDSEHLLTQGEIINLIRENYAIEIERKAVSRNIDFLMDYGYTIIKEGRGYYLADRDFDSSEVTFLIDSVFSNKSIPSKNATELVKKLANLLSKNERKNYKYIYKLEQGGGTYNKQYFYTIDQVTRAIEAKKQISFNYSTLKIENAKPLEVKKEHIVNPYFMVNNNGKYYLVCNKVGYETVANYKIDSISDVKVLKNDLVAFEDIVGQKCNEKEYLNEHIYMFNGESVEASLKVVDGKGLSAIYEWFSRSVRLYSKEDYIVAKVVANEQALVYWLLQYGELIEVLEPTTLREKVISAIENLQKKYNC